MISLGTVFASFWCSMVHIKMEDFENDFFLLHIFGKLKYTSHFSHVQLWNYAKELISETSICRFWYASNVDKSVNSDFPSDFTCRLHYAFCSTGSSLIQDSI